MANDKADTDKELEIDGSGKKKKLIIIVAVVVVLAAVGGGAFMFMGGEDPITQETMAAELDSGDSTGDDQITEAPSVITGTALYVPMPRPFRFNVPGASRDRFVEIRVQLLVRGGNNEETAKKHIPLIESTFLSVFSQANADDLATSAGKASLKQQALVEVQETLKDISGDATVEKVLFTGFVMQ